MSLYSRSTLKIRFFDNSQNIKRTTFKNRGEGGRMKSVKEERVCKEVCASSFSYFSSPFHLEGKAVNGELHASLFLTPIS
mmetsp:Transcript_74470/g.86469  ORF Transcript_74470/g.86469 Transcript_74470/m.86469 type:complete len:80 (-) Transcript_74470:696-935(-)